MGDVNMSPIHKLSAQRDSFTLSSASESCFHGTSCLAASHAGSLERLLAGKWDLGTSSTSIGLGRPTWSWHLPAAQAKFRKKWEHKCLMQQVWAEFQALSTQLFSLTDQRESFETPIQQSSIQSSRHLYPAGMCIYLTQTPDIWSLARLKQNCRLSPFLPTIPSKVLFLFPLSPTTPTLDKSQWVHL